ncbi:MAG TPA: MFS transporter [Xanthobacteraceae bacterium]|nr:MFS transporter [Xanthobacteraceae bacterium]
MDVDADAEKTIIRKIYLRLLPLLFVAYFICYLDRINVSFAALTMNKDLGFTATVYALGATAFFWGYCLFEVPSNMILDRVGARIWIARIMITWGLFSGLTAFVTDSTSFATVRFFLGVCEAGFFPGMILYFTYWFPAQYRGRVVGWFMTAIPIAIFMGGPISTNLLVWLEGLFGLAGWRWVFLCEATPAVILGFVVFFYLTDRPAQAHWLEPHEREWLTAQLEAERTAIDLTGRPAAFHSLLNMRVLAMTAIAAAALALVLFFLHFMLQWSIVTSFETAVLVILGPAGLILFGYTLLPLLNLRSLALAVIYLGIATASLGLVLFLPLMLKQLGLSTLATGYVSPIPYIAGTIGMIVCGYITDRMLERRWNLFFTCLAAAVGLCVAGLLSSSLWALAGLSLATIGFYGMKTSFWPLPSTYLSGTAAAAAIAAINSLGNFGGLIGPVAVGWLKDHTGSFESGLYFLGGCALVSAIVTLIAVHERHMPTRARVGMAPA